MKNPIEFFFSLGDKVTKGNPQKKADFDYAMLWVIFIAFLTVLIGYIHSFIVTLDITKLGWSIVIFGVLWFQYFTLMGSRESRKYLKSIPLPKPDEKEKIEDIDEMIKGFNKKEKDGDGQGHRRIKQ